MRGFKTRAQDLSGIMMILGLGFGAYAMPHVRFGPYGLLDLKSFAEIVVAVGSIQILGHFACSILGRTLGTSISGLIGGFVSSTAVFVSLAPQLKSHPDEQFAFFASALFAVVAMLLEALFIVAFQAPQLVAQAAYLFLPMIVIALLVVAISFKSSMRRQGQASAVPVSSPSVTAVSILKMAFFISVVFFVVAISNRAFGARSAGIANFLSGLFEIHAVVFATADLYVRGELARPAALNHLAIATTAGIFSKVLLLGFLQRGRFAILVSTVLLLMLAVGILNFYFQI